jgi:hypothetical protein
MTTTTRHPGAAKALRIALFIDLGLIALFGLSSGLYKVFGGMADVTLYAAIGVGPVLMAVIGAIQAGAAAALVFTHTRRVGALVLAAVNGLASAVLFANHIQPFGAISLLFIAMALAPLALAPRQDEASVAATAD